MNKLPLAKRAQILGLLVEGTSLRATSRLADCSINTVTKLLVDAGKACAAYQDKTLRNLPCKRIQVDEIWAFCYAKAKNVETPRPLRRTRETFGPGLPFVPLPSWLHRGWSAVVMAATHTSL